MESWPAAVRTCCNHSLETAVSRFSRSIVELHGGRSTLDQLPSAQIADLRGHGDAWRGDHPCEAGGYVSIRLTRRGVNARANPRRFTDSSRACKATGRSVWKYFL